jgi:hypothetical protein
MSVASTILLAEQRDARLIGLLHTAHWARYAALGAIRFTATLVEPVVDSFLPEAVRGHQAGWRVSSA